MVALFFAKIQRRFRRRRRFHQTLSVNADPQDLSDQPLLLDMIFLGTPQLRGGVNIFFFTKCPLRNTLMYTCTVYTTLKI